MRVDLTSGGRRPWHMRLGMALIRWRTGLYAGPPLALSYRPDLFHRSFIGYTLRGMHGAGGWNKGHAELFGTFVSHLNSCSF